MKVIPQRWREVLREELPWQRGRIWQAQDLIDLAAHLAGRQTEG